MLQKTSPHVRLGESWLKRFRLAFVGLSGALAMSGPAVALDVLRIGVPDTSVGTRTISVGHVDVLIENKFLERALENLGIKVEWIYFKGAGPAVNEALANRQVDIGFVGDLPGIIGKAQGVDTRLIATSNRNAPYFLGVRPDSDIKGLADLKGREVAVFRGTVLQLSLAKALTTARLNERDLRGINLDVNASNAALAGGQLDAVWGTSSLLALQEKGLAKVVLSTRDIGNVGASQGLVVANRAVLEDEPKLLELLKRAELQAYEWLANPANKEPYLKRLREFGFAESAVRDLSERDFAVDFDPRLDEQFLAHLQESIDLAADLKVIRKPFLIDEWL